MNTNLKNRLTNLLKKLDVTKPSLKKEINEGTQTLIKFPYVPTKKQAQDLFYALIFKDPSLLMNEKNKELFNNFLLETELFNETKNKIYLTFRNYLEELGYGKSSKEATRSYKNGKF